MERKWPQTPFEVLLDVWEQGAEEIWMDQTYGIDVMVGTSKKAFMSVT